MIEDRAGLRATIVTSQLPVGHWHEAIGDPTIADAVLDRCSKTQTASSCAGESMRRAADGTRPRQARTATPAPAPAPEAGSGPAPPGRPAPSAARTAARS